MEKLMDLFSLFRKGSEVSNPEAWKDGGNAATLLVPAMMAVLKVMGDYGLSFQMDSVTATAIAGGVVSFVQFIVHNVSSARAGILPSGYSPLDGKTRF